MLKDVPFRGDDHPSVVPFIRVKNIQRSLLGLCSEYLQKDFPELVPYNRIVGLKRLFPFNCLLSKDLRVIQLHPNRFLLVPRLFGGVIGERYNGIGFLRILPKGDNVLWDDPMVSSFLSSPRIKLEPLILWSPKAISMTGNH